MLLLVLWLVVLSVPSSTENEGFLVSFGDSFDAGGGGNEASVNIQKPYSPKAIQPSAKENVVVDKTSNQNVFTQKDNSVSIAEQKEKERVSKEQEAIRVQQNETNKRIAEQKQKQQEAINKANAVNGLFGNGGTGGGTGGGNGIGSGKGTGTGTKDGIQGNPAGKGNTGFPGDLKLGNRNYYGNPVRPIYPKDVEGKITVTIRVDENGNVTSASIGSPTDISDPEMRRGAISAATKTRFTTGKGIETGSITYNYRLKIN